MTVKILEFCNDSTPLISGQKLNNLGRGLHGHHNRIQSPPAVKVEKMFYDLINFQHMAVLAPPLNGLNS